MSRVPHFWPPLPEVGIFIPPRQRCAPPARRLKRRAGRFSRDQVVKDLVVTEY